MQSTLSVLCSLQSFSFSVISVILPRYQESAYHMIAASLLQSTKGPPQAQQDSRGTDVCDITQCIRNENICHTRRRVDIWKQYEMYATVYENIGLAVLGYSKDQRCPEQVFWTN